LISAFAVEKIVNRDNIGNINASFLIFFTIIVC
jgi:hypothetical protein